MKKIILILCLLIIPLVLGNQYDYPSLEITPPYIAHFTTYFVPGETLTPINKPATFLFYIYLDDLLEHGLLDTPLNTFSSVYSYGTPAEVIDLRLVPTTSYGVIETIDITATDISDYPYYIKSCHIKCDSTSVLYDYSYYPYNNNYGSSMELNFDCQYSSDDIESSTPKYLSVYCEIESRNSYSLKGGYIDMSELFTSLNEYWGDKADYGYTCTQNTLLLGSNPSKFRDDGAKCIGYMHQLFRITPAIEGNNNFTIGGSSNQTSNYKNISLINSSEAELDGLDNEIGGAGGSNTPDRTKQSENKKQLEKQKDYEQQLRLIQKKNQFISNLISICMILFSIILLSYYIIAIGILGYLVSFLFPQIMSLPYKVINSFRRKKGDI